MPDDTSFSDQDPAENISADGDAPPNPSVFLENDDGTRTLLSDDAPPRPLTGLDNNFAVSNSTSRGTPSDAPTTVNDHGDTAQLQQQKATTQAKIPRHPEEILAGVGRGLTYEVPDADTAFELSDSESEEDLWTSIDDQLVSVPVNDGKQFLPLNKLRRIISRRNVARELRKLPGLSIETVHDYVNKVCETTQIGNLQKTTRQRMFAILVMIDHVEGLSSLISQDLHDAHLPFEYVRKEGNKWTLHFKAPDGTDTLFQGSCEWKNPKVKAFFEKQWLLLSPFFDMQAGKVLFHPLEPKIILPFIDGVEGKNTAWGGFSVVWRAKIHSAHHNYAHHTEPSFAIKKLKSLDKPEFERELHALNKLKLKGHRHVMTLLATYEHHEHRHFVFPWADKNLREFWQHFRKPQPDHSLVIWLAEQCAGIAEGLSLIQHPPTDTSLSTQDRRDFGRHGDLKPENVLWFRDSNHREDVPGSGTLKIADFGLTRFHHDATKSGINASNLSVSLTYKAPEVDVTKKVSPSYDIWTLGCLLLEFVTWYLMGWEGVDEFSCHRADEEAANDIPLDTFFNVVIKKGAKVAVIKSSVKKWVQKLKAQPDCSLFFRSLLTYISQHLLQLDQTKRHKCEDVVKTLEKMKKHCHQDKRFAFEGCPEPTTKTDVTQDPLGLCTSGSPTKEENYVVLDDLQAERPDSDSAHGPGRAFLDGVEQPTSITVPDNSVQEGPLSPEISPNSGQGQPSSKRTRAASVTEEPGSEAKRPRM